MRLQLKLAQQSCMVSISLQFFDNGSASWIVSGRWMVEINHDINGVVPQSIKNLNVSLSMISADGLVAKKYGLSDFQESTSSYDKHSYCEWNTQNVY